MYRWEFDNGKESLVVAVTGPLTVDDVTRVIRAALDGTGLAFISEELAAPHLACGGDRGGVAAACPASFALLHAHDPLHAGPFFSCRPDVVHASGDAAAGVIPAIPGDPVRPGR